MKPQHLLCAIAFATLIGGNAIAADAVQTAVGFHGRPELDVKRDKTVQPAGIVNFIDRKSTRLNSSH